LNSKDEFNQWCGRLHKILFILGQKSPPLYNASALSIYGSQPAVSEKLLPAVDENTSLDWDHYPDFLTGMCRDSEKAAKSAIDCGVRVTFLRFGVVLASEGGVLPRMVKPFQLFMGGPVGSGHQAFSWITIDDALRAIDFLIANPNVSGPVNLVAPECVTQRQLAKEIGKVINRPAVLTMPAPILKFILGEMSYLLLEGQCLCPRRLLELGFKFNYPKIEPALKHILLQL